MNVPFLKTVVTSWYWYGFVILWIIAGETESFSSNALLSLYMKSTNKYTVAQLNNYPTGVPAIGIISTLFWATLTDFLNGKRYLVAYFIAITGIVTSAMILTTSHVPTIFAAYYWAGAVYACQATFFAWANEAMRFENDALRAIVIASMNCGSGAVNAWWSLLFYGADEAPRFTKGMWAMIGTSIALAVWTTILLWGLKRGERRRDARAMTERTRTGCDDLEVVASGERHTDFKTDGNQALITADSAISSDRQM